VLRNAGSVVIHAKPTYTKLKPRNAQSANGERESHSRRKEPFTIVIVRRKSHETPHSRNKVDNERKALFSTDRTRYPLDNAV
jgi:hypothetical protein